MSREGFGKLYLEDDVHEWGEERMFAFSGGGGSHVLLTCTIRKYNHLCE